MGAANSKADTTKITHTDKNHAMEYICMEMRGWRKQMQDSAIFDLEIQTPPNNSNFKNSLFAVFDGHGTNYISRFLKENFIQVLTQLPEYKEEKYAEALELTFKQLDELMLSEQGQAKLKKIKKQEDEDCETSRYHPVGKIIGDMCGSTANVVLITEKFYYVANTGDSRSILCRSGYTINLSQDHKPQDPIEVQRIKKANGYINRGRINNMLSVSRAFGDFELKDYKNLPWDERIVTCKPDIETFARSSRDNFIMLACDGIWENRQKSKEVIDLFVKQKSFKHEKYQLALENLLNKLIAKNQNQQMGQDNMTALFVKFYHEEGSERGSGRVSENQKASQENEEKRDSCS